MDTSTEFDKPLRYTEISNTERNVGRVMDVLENEYFNPFGVSIDQQELYNLSSGTRKENSVQALQHIR